MENRILKFLPLTSQNSIFENLENPQNFFCKIRELFVFVLQCIQRQHVHIEIENGREAHLNPSIYRF